MHLESQIVISRTPEQVSTFLGDISNVAKWDRGVSVTRQTSTPQTGNGIGLEFDTVGHGGNPDDPNARGQMFYRLAEVGPNHSVVELTSSKGNTRFFKEARWTFRLQPDPHGTLVVCEADFKLRSRYILLAPVFYGMNDAIHKDLENLKKVLEKTVLP